MKNYHNDSGKKEADMLENNGLSHNSIQFHA